MFKSEYQGGKYVDVFSAQGSEPLSKKCKLNGSSNNIYKEYDKDVKGYVYILKGEATTTKLHFPKDEKLGLFLTQRFLVFQLFVPMGRPFSVEVTVVDRAQNKRRISFSSNLKDISVTPLHARFPFDCLKQGSWLNMCIDVESFVSETFNGSKFRAIENFTVTANCRLKKVFTLRSPPPADSGGSSQYDHCEQIPGNVQLITTNGICFTQILSYITLRHGNGNMATSRIHPEANTKETHIAFGSKVVIPPHVRQNSSKENRESRKTSLNSSQSKISQSDATSAQAPASPKVDIRNDRMISGVDVTMQPRPPRNNSVGKSRRRPLRLKTFSAVTAVDNANNKENVATRAVAQETNRSKTEKFLHGDSEVKTSQRMETRDEDTSSSSDAMAPPAEKASYSSTNHPSPVAHSVVEMMLPNENSLLPSSTNLTFIQETSSEAPIKATGKQVNALSVQNQNYSATEDNVMDVLASITNINVPLEQQVMNLTETSAGNYRKLQQMASPAKEPSANEGATADEPCGWCESTKQLAEENNDVNNNERWSGRPQKLPLASGNPVFTFASMPRSPRSGKKKLLQSPNIMTSPPEVTVSLNENEGRLSYTPGKSPGGTRGVSLDDDFHRISDEEMEENPVMQELSESNLPLRHSPQHLRHSIRSSMLKEIPSPSSKDNSYDAQNYQSRGPNDLLNQSTASSWRLDESRGSDSFDQSQNLEDSLNDDRVLHHLAAIADIPPIDEEGAQSDGSDDTSCSTWRAPPQELRENKYQNEMKPPRQEPDLTATVNVNMDPREHCDVFTPPVMMLHRSPQQMQESEQEEELDLLYDPCLNCYYDPKTHKYYELA